MMFLLVSIGTPLVNWVGRYANSLKIQTETEIPVGSVMRVSRRFFWHYGVYVGNREVVHFTSEHSNISKDNRIQATSFEIFIDDAKVFQILQFPDCIEGVNCYSPIQTAERARQKIGEHQYSIADNNCQHFAIWCKTGHHFSGQVLFDSPFAAFSNVLMGGDPDRIDLKGIKIKSRVSSTDYRPM